MTKKTNSEVGEKLKGKIAVLITTDSSKRGVFAGFIDPADIDKETFTAEEVRMCVSWSADMKGVLGLASMGPSESCKISKAVRKATLRGVTAVVDISDEALKRWRSEPWG